MSVNVNIFQTISQCWGFSLFGIAKRCAFSFVVFRLSLELDSIDDNDDCGSRSLAEEYRNWWWLINLKVVCVVEKRARDLLESNTDTLSRSRDHDESQERNLYKVLISVMAADRNKIFEKMLSNVDLQVVLGLEYIQELVIGHGQRY